MLATLALLCSVERPPSEVRPVPPAMQIEAVRLSAAASTSTYKEPTRSPDGAGQPASDAATAAVPRAPPPSAPGDYPTSAAGSPAPADMAGRRASDEPAQIINPCEINNNLPECH